MKSLSSIYTISLCIFTMSLASFAYGDTGGHTDSAAGISHPCSVPFQLDPEGHIILTAKIDGITGRFILDPGAGLNVITRRFAGKLPGLTKEDGCFTGFRATGEAMRLSIYQLKEIQIGEMKTSDPVTTVIDADLGNTDGLISLTCFRDHPFTIDFAFRKLWIETRASLAARAREGDKVPIQVDDQRGISLDMFARVKVDSKLSLDVVLDSGAGFNVFRFDAGFIKEIGIDTATVKKIYKKSTFDKRITEEFYIDRLNELALASAPSVNVRNVKAALVNGLIYDGITCINWLGNRITIDLPDRKLIVN